MAMFQHTLGILTHPDREWQRIRNQRQSFWRVYLLHVPLLALIPVLAAYYGVTQVGWRVGSGELVKLTSQSALTLCIGTYIAQLVAVYVLGEFINWMSRTFGVEDAPEQRHYEGTALAVYIATPMMLAGAILAYPQLWVVVGVLTLAGCYSIYLLYQGIPILMNIPKEQGFIYASSVVTVGLVLLVVMMVTTVIIWDSGMGPVYTS